MQMTTLLYYCATQLNSFISDTRIWGIANSTFHTVLLLYFCQVFDANIDSKNVANITLDANGISTRFVRIYPINCVKQGNAHDACYMRFEILGCSEL